MAADAFHRQHAIVELASREPKDDGGAEHISSGHYLANAASAWFACAVIAHNLARWTITLGGHEPVNTRTLRSSPFPPLPSTAPDSPPCGSRPCVV